MSATAKLHSPWNTWVTKAENEAFWSFHSKLPLYTLTVLKQNWTLYKGNLLPLLRYRKSGKVKKKISYSYGEKIVKEKNLITYSMLNIWWKWQTLSNCNAVSEKCELLIQIFVKKDDYSLSLKPNIQRWIKMWSS